MKRKMELEKGVIKKIGTICYIIISLIFTSALVSAIMEYSEIQRTEISFKARVTDLNITNDSQTVTISITVLFSNPSHLEVSAYQIGVNLGIYNSTRDEVVNLGLLTDRVKVQPGKNELIILILKIDQNTTNPRLRLGLDTMRPGKPGVERIWVLWGEGNCYVLPSNFYFRVDISAVIRR